MKTMPLPQSSIHEVVNISNFSCDGHDKEKFKEITHQLKRKFHESDSSSEKVKILTVLLPSWGVQRISERHQTGWQGKPKI
jgi:L-rhamnose isomerase